MKPNQLFNNATCSSIKHRMQSVKVSLMLAVTFFLITSSLNAQSCGTVSFTETVNLGGDLVITVTGATQFSGPASLFVIINGGAAPGPNGGIYNGTCTGTNPYSCDFNIVIPQSLIGGVGTYTIQTTQSPGATTCLNSTFCIVDPSNPPIIDGFSVTDESCPGANNGTITINNVSGGIAGYQYSSDNGATFQSQNYFNSLAPGIYNLKVKDACGIISSSWPAVINPGNDFIPPSITCPGSQTVSANTDCQALLPDYTGQATTSDNCDVSPTVTQTPPAGTILSGVGTVQTVTLRSTDADDNFAECTFDVTVQDNIAPSITCTGPITVNNDLGQCGAVVNYAPPVGTDNCPGAVTALTAGLGSGAFFPVGETTEIYTVTDAAGNQVSCSFKVTVIDNEPPAIVCQDMTASLNASGEFQISAAFVFANAFVSRTDNCEINNSVNLTGPLVYTCDNLGDNAITIFTFDINGNRSQCTVNLVITDPLSACNQPPVAVCQDLTVSADANCENGTLTAADFNGGSTDPDGDALTYSISPAGPYALGVTNVVLSVNDGEFTETCTATVTVVDNTAPSITCPADANLEWITGLDYFNPNIANGFASATDDCDPNVLIQWTDAITSGSCDGNFKITRTWTATDAAGNQSSCVQMITVVDTTAPLAPSPPADLNLECADDLPPPINLTATDNCEGDITVGPTTQVIPGFCINNFTLVRTWTFTDSCGNTSSVSQTIVVQDDVAPVIQSPIPANLNLECADDVPPPVNLTATDNCNGNITVAPTIAINPGASINDFVEVRTWTFSDACGNSSSISQTITVKDETAPTITCPDSVVVDTDEGLCSASVVLPTPTILDNCRVTGINVSLNGNPIFDHLFVSEGLGGLEQPRQIVFGPDGHLYVSNLILTENGTKGNVLKFNGTTGDLIMEIGGPSGSTSLAFPRGISFGPDGNLYVASQNSSEVLRFDPNSGNLIDAFIPAGTGGLTFPTGLVFGPDNHLYVADRFDNSVRKYDGISGAFLGDFVAAGSGGLSFPIGLEFGPDGHLFIASLNTNSVKTYDGISGAFLGDFVTTSSGGLLGPEDLEFAPDGNLYVSSFFEGKVLVYDGTTGAYLNEVSNSFATLVSADGLTFGPDGHLYASSLGSSEIWRYPLGEFDIPVGDNTITWTTSDAAGNLSDCSYTVTVNDTEAPTITCPVDVIITSTAGECNGLADLGTPTFNDNCPGATVDNDAPDTFPFGDTIVTWTVTDAAGNTAECTQKVTVEKINTITSVTVNPTSQQYSDLVAFEAVIQPGDCPGAGLAAGKVEFLVGTQSVGTVLMQVEDGNLVGRLTAPLLETPSNPSNGQMTPGNHTVTAVFHNLNPNYNVSNATTDLTITKENVEIDYNGQTLQATTSSNSSTATVSLSLNILDIDDSNRGDIRNATVTIVNRDNSNAVIYGPVLVSDLVIPGDNTLGTISYDWAVDIGNSDSASYTLGFIIDGYYTRNSSDDNTVVTVYKPNGDFITGGGYILPDNSAGQYAATPGLKTNFGFNVKYNRNGKKLKGHMNIIFRRLESDGVHTYQIKGNAMQSLGVDISDEDNLFAEFITKANLTDITDPNNTISLGGNLLLKTEMTDRGEPGVDDSIGINLTESNGTLLYSSNWSGISTEEMVLAGGNIVVHSGFSAASETTTRVQTEDNFKVKSDENPFDKNAFISLDSSDKSSLVTYSVFDSNNKFLYTKHLQPNQKFTFGEGLKSGVYLVIVQQGNNKGQIKMIKK